MFNSNVTYAVIQTLICQFSQIFRGEELWITTAKALLQVKLYSYYPLKMECGCLHGGVIENGHTHNPLTLWTLSVLVHVRVWVHILGDAQSVQLRNGTTTTTTNTVIVPGSSCFWVLLLLVARAADFPLCVCWANVLHLQ